MLGYASLSQVLPRKTQHVSHLSLLTAAKSFKCQGPLLSLDVDITKHGRQTLHRIKFLPIGYYRHY